MTVSNRFRNAAFIALSFLLSCDSPDKSLPDAGELVDRFVKSAKDHERTNIATDNLIIVLKDSIYRNGRFYCGYSSTDPSGNKIMELDIKSDCWNMGENSREIIVFHELSHLYLNRSHRDSKLPNGDWRSLMNSGTLLDLYNAPGAKFKRPYYLDELFDDQTLSPDWSK